VKAHLEFTLSTLAVVLSAVALKPGSAVPILCFTIGLLTASIANRSQ